jgi:hypothetical protein
LPKYTIHDRFDFFPVLGAQHHQQIPAFFTQFGKMQLVVKNLTPVAKPFPQKRMDILDCRPSFSNAYHASPPIERRAAYSCPILMPRQKQHARQQQEFCGDHENLYSRFFAMESGIESKNLNTMLP